MWTYMMAAARGDRANSMMSARRRNEVESPKYGYNLSRPMYRSIRLNNGPSSHQNCQTTTLGSSYPYTTSTSHHHHYGGMGNTTTTSSSGYSQQQQQQHQQQHHHPPHHVVGIDDVYTNPGASETYDMEDGTSLFSPLAPTSTTMTPDTAVLIARKHMMNRKHGPSASGSGNDFGNATGGDEQNCLVGSQAAVVRLPSRRTTSTSSNAYYNESDEDDDGDDFGHIVKCSDKVTKPTTLVIDHKRRIRHHDNQEHIDDYYDDDEDGDSLDDDDDDEIDKENEANYNENVIENGKKLSQQRWTFDLIDIDSDSSDRNMVDLDYKVVRISRGVYGFSGYINIKVDINDDSLLTVTVERSKSRDGPYYNTPMSIDNVTITEGMNGFYKNTFMDTAMKCCKNVPYIKDKFEAPLTKRLIEINKCVFETDNLPNVLMEGYYKLRIAITGPFLLYLEVLAFVENKKYFEVK